MNASNHDDDLRGLLGWLLLVIFGIAFAVLAFWFLNSVDGDSGNDIANTPPSPVTTERIDVDEIVLGRVSRELDRRASDSNDPLTQGASSFELSVDDGVVTIVGMVDDEQERNRVLAAIRTLPGVVGIVDWLEAPLPEPTPTEPPAPSEDEIRSALLALYEEHGVEGEPELVDGVWIISGLAPDDAARAALAGAVRRVDGVDRSRNQVIVSGEVGSPATENSTVVDVTRGLVTLEGLVPSEEARVAVLEAAQQVFGAGNVVDELTVDPNAEGRVVVSGDVDAARFADLEGAFASLGALGLQTDIQAEAVELSADQAALQEELDAAVAEIVINFSSGSAFLGNNEAAKLTPIIEILTGASDVLVAVEGHTDDQGNAAANQELSQRRAESVVAYLVEQGVDESLLRAVGNGPSQPIADNSTSEGRAQNRRTEFRVVV